MTTQTITGVQAGAYYLHAPVTTLSITAKGDIEGNALYGVAALAATGAYSVVNAGTVQGGLFGVLLTDGGAVTNTNLIDGAQGVLIRGAAGTVSNTATITGTAYGAVYLGHGGSVSNSGLLSGVTFGAQITGAAGTVTNSGGIDAGAGALDVGVLLERGGQFDNTGAVSAANGVVVESERGVVDNFGSIHSVATASAFGGVYLADGGWVTNEVGAQIGGNSGVVLGAAGKVTNFGEITGSGGYSVDFRSSGSTLVAEAGSTFVGEAWGGGGTLDFADGSGAFDSIAAGGAVSLVQGGTYPDATFADFATVEIARPAKFTLTGTGDVTVANLDVLGTLAVTGALTTSAAIAGTGTLALDGGTSTFDAGSNLAVANVVVTGSATAATFAAKRLTLSDAWDQKSGTISVGAGDKVSFSGVGDIFSGTLAGGGVVDLTGGSDLLAGTTLAATTEIDGAAVTLSNAVDLTGNLDIFSAGLEVAAGGATLTGDGAIRLSALTSNFIAGAAAGATLTNAADIIEGAGKLGGLSIVNEAGGTIESNLTSSLVIDTGAGSLINAGMITNLSTGGLTIDGAVDNSGTLNVASGTLSVDGDVSGAGAVRVAGGTASFGGAFAQNVTFGVGGGTLRLANSQGFDATISGYSKTGGTALDLEDIAFGSGTTAAYSGTTKGGVLTVTDGTDTARIDLTGNYTGVTFEVAGDGGSGTLVTAAIPPAPASAPVLAAAIAAFAPAPASTAAHGDRHQLPGRAMLATPSAA